MIDCHCHLSDREFDSDLDDVVSRAKAAGVIACIVVPENINDFPRVLDICGKHEGFLFPCLGVHPAQNFRDEKVVVNRVVPSSLRMRSLGSTLPSVIYLAEYLLCRPIA